MAKLKYCFVLFFILHFSFFIVNAQEKYRTQIFDNEIKTLQIYQSGNPFSYPVLTLGSNEQLSVSFDQMSHSTQNYSYAIVHCNADWTPSGLFEAEYIDGFSKNIIENYELSMNTTLDYMHYWFDFPNRDFQFKVSGNYVVKVYVDNEPDKVLCTATFSVVEPLVNVFGKIRANTDIDTQNKHQQIDFEVINNKFQIRDVMTELKATVRQNNRPDNEATGLKPTFIAPGKQSYINNRALIFEGGNEFRQFDVSTIRTLDFSVENISFVSPYFHVELKQDGILNNLPYQFRQDVNGMYVINLQLNDFNDETEADYVFVHFSLYSKEPSLMGKVYLSGDLTQRILDENSEMTYNFSTHCYEKTLLLKQGGYNYQYLFVGNGETTGQTAPIEGSHWQTENDYQIFVFHRGFGDRYDRLIGYQLLNNK
ncbi:MAG: DUF5103 domain-containing protein [Bacteroidales bacterium]|jgi:hypothetical protein|nr:DUF5103 domain-containing protein [Bacteroidales bacterium]